MERIPGVPHWLAEDLPPLAVTERHCIDVLKQAREWPGFIENENGILKYLQTHSPAPTIIMDIWRAYKAVVK